MSASRLRNSPDSLGKANNSLDVDTKGVGVSVCYCFDYQRSIYWIKDNRGVWISLNETQFKRQLIGLGISPLKAEDSYLSPVNQFVNTLQLEHSVDYAGPLAGYDSGVREIYGQRILVTQSPRIIEPRRGKWPFLSAVITNLFKDPQFDQVPYVYGWLKVGYEAVRSGERRPGQALALAGPADCGKSLFQSIITELLGGRSAKPYQYMAGLSPFNGELFGAEHLVIEDEIASTDIRARRNFGAHIKGITASENSQRCHAKNRNALRLDPFWRLSISVNDEPENLMILPPIDDSILDKLILLRTSFSPMPMPTEEPGQRKFFFETLLSELPAFLHFLLKWRIPEGLLSRRFGIAHFHHPEILQAIDALAPEFRLLSLIDDRLFSGSNDTWEGTAEELERFLTGEDSACRFEARRLFTFNTACGVYLARLKTKYPERFISKHTKRGNQWTINQSQ